MIRMEGTFTCGWKDSTEEVRECLPPWAYKLRYDRMNGALLRDLPATDILR